MTFKDRLAQTLRHWRDAMGSEREWTVRFKFCVQQGETASGFLITVERHFGFRQRSVKGLQFQTWSTEDASLLCDSIIGNATLSRIIISAAQVFTLCILCCVRLNSMFQIINSSVNQRDVLLLCIIKLSTASWIRSHPQLVYQSHFPWAQMYDARRQKLTNLRWDNKINL